MPQAPVLPGPYSIDAAAPHVFERTIGADGADAGDPVSLYNARPVSSPQEILELYKQMS